jgi:hypothetical protein
MIFRWKRSRTKKKSVFVKYVDASWPHPMCRETVSVSHDRPEPSSGKQKRLPPHVPDQSLKIISSEDPDSEQARTAAGEQLACSSWCLLCTSLTLKPSGTAVCSAANAGRNRAGANQDNVLQGLASTLLSRNSWPLVGRSEGNRWGISRGLVKAKNKRMQQASNKAVARRVVGRPFSGLSRDLQAAAVSHFVLAFSGNRDSRLFLLCEVARRLELASLAMRISLLPGVPGNSTLDISQPL